MSKILILGRSGQVAAALAHALPAVGREVTALGRAECDLADPAAARAAVRTHAPDIVINAAAYTAVDQAEDDRDAAFALNALGPGAAAAAAAERGAVFIHFSTDYVFDGTKGAPYLESDPTAPLGVYGESKLAGEAAVSAANPRSIILRTAWVCSPTGANFLKTMLRLAAERPLLRVVDDQRGAPSFAADLAAGAAQIVHGLETPPGPPQGAYGVFHLVNGGETTWCGFARAILEGAAARGAPSCPVQAIATAEYPTRARRPADSRLDAAKVANVHRVRLQDWRPALETCLDAMLGPAGPNSARNST